MTNEGGSTGPQGVSVGMGLLKSFMHPTWDGSADGEGTAGEVSVTGRVIFDRALNSDVVEIMMTLRENRQSHYIQQGYSYSVFSQPATGISAYGSSPAHINPVLTANPTHRQEKERKMRNHKHNALGKASGSAQQPILLDEAAPKPRKTTPQAQPQAHKYDDDVLKEIATLLAKVNLR